MKPRIGSLFSGSGMLDEGVRSVLGGDVAWHAEVDLAACRVLAHRYPDVPNLGDITAVDWSAVEPVDVITGGSPCQDVSHAGKRAGMRAGTRSGLWARMCDAIESLRPSLVVWENVRGVLSAEADSALEPCPGCVGDRDDGAVLRALGRVLGDLAELGYDAQWHGLRAADVGAPHGRFRVFVVATDAGDRANDGQRSRAESRWGSRVASDAGRLRGQSGRVAAPGQAQSRESLTVPSQRGRVDAPTNAHGDALRVEPVAVTRSGSASVARHPRPDTLADTARDGWDEGRPEPARLVGGPHAAVCGDVASDADDDAAGNGREPRHQGGSGSESAQRRDALADSEGDEQREPVVRLGQWTEPWRSDHRTDWGPYEPAIRRWEAVLGRPAPAPTEPGARGGQRLSPRLTEWMMGWPDGWVTDVPGVSRNDALRICGNGVVPQQAAEAIRRMLNAARAAA